MQPEFYPLLFDPVYKDYLWGGSRIASRYHRDVPSPRVAESWEVSAHPDGPSIVANGDLAGQSLDRLVADYPEQMVGRGRVFDRFPLLIKILDAQACLSLQVHPNDRSAAETGGDPKTEMWYLLEAESGSGIYAGFREPTDSESFRSALTEGRVTDLVSRETVAAGDAVYVPGGLLHAIDAGCLLLEVQQTSNTTYRVHDWGRVDASGQPREVHLDRAVQVLDWGAAQSAKVSPKRLLSEPWGEAWLVLECPYFRMERLVLNQAMSDRASRDSFRVYFCAAGAAVVEANGESVWLAAGSSCLVPACLEDVELRPEGSATLLRVSLPPPD